MRSAETVPNVFGVISHTFDFQRRRRRSARNGFAFEGIDDERARVYTFPGRWRLSDCLIGSL